MARALRSSIPFCGGIAAVLAIACIVGGGWLAGLVDGNSAGLRGIAEGYLIARAPTLVLLVPFTLLAAILNSHKRPKPVMVATITVNVANLLLDFVLIFGPGGLPRLGAVGNGLATTVAWAAGVVILVVCLRRSDVSVKLRNVSPALVRGAISRKAEWPSNCLYLPRLPEHAGVLCHHRRPRS